MFQRQVSSSRQRVRRSAARAFTLLEASMTLVILGVGVMAFVEAQQSFMDANSWSSQAATATFLANELRERMRKLPRHDPVTGLSLNGTTVVGWGRDTGETVIGDLDDVDDYDGLRFGSDGNMAGPVNAFGEVIAEMDANGSPLMNGNAVVPMRGWSQEVTVEKINPADNTSVLTPAYSVAASGSNPGRPLDRFPLRVTVKAFYRGPMDSASHEVIRMSWIVPE